MRDQIPNIENDQSIKNLLGALKRVQAPDNFEFGVKARIAKGAPKESASPFAFLKIAVPAAALASLAAFLYVSGFMSGEIPSVQVVEQPARHEVVKPTMFRRRIWHRRSLNWPQTYARRR